MAYGLVIDSIGNSCLTGFTSGNFPNIGGRTNAGVEDIFLAKLGIGGTLFWGTIIGNSGDNEGMGIILNPTEDSLFVTGFTEGNLDGQPSAGGYDTFLMKFDPDTGGLQ